jgi:hypothetical protein
VFYVIRLSTRENSFFLNMTPQKTPKQKGLFMGFPGTFERLKSRPRQMAGKQVRCGPNGPGNQAPGRSATMVTRTVSHGRYSIKFRSTCPCQVFILPNSSLNPKNDLTSSNPKIRSDHNHSLDEAKDFTTQPQLPLQS